MPAHFLNIQCHPLAFHPHTHNGWRSSPLFMLFVCAESLMSKNMRHIRPHPIIAPGATAYKYSVPSSIKVPPPSPHPKELLKSLPNGTPMSHPLHIPSDPINGGGKILFRLINGTAHQILPSPREHTGQWAHLHACSMPHHDGIFVPLFSSSFHAFHGTYKNPAFHHFRGIKSQPQKTAPQRMGHRHSSNFSPLLLRFLLPTILLFLLRSGTTSAYYTQHFYLPTGYFGNSPFDRPSALAGVRPSSSVLAGATPIQKQPLYLNSVADEPKVLAVEAEMDDADGNDDDKDGAAMARQRPAKWRAALRPAGGKMVGGRSWERGFRDQVQAIPRRQMRHLLADEFGMSGRMGRQYKRMRPCFYSPIQCLMKRKRAAAE